MFPPIPYLFSFRSRRSWGQLSKIFTKSRKITSIWVEWFLDLAHAQSSRVNRSCVTVDLPLGLANGCSLSTLGYSRIKNSVTHDIFSRSCIQ